MLSARKKSVSSDSSDSDIKRVKNASGKSQFYSNK